MTATGADIPIEERAAAEVLMVRGVRLAPPDTTVRNPAFDVTPAELITGVITEEGVARPPFDSTLADAVAIRARRRASTPGFAALTAPTA